MEMLIQVWTKGIYRENSKDSDQTARMCSLIRIFAVCIMLYSSLLIMSLTLFSNLQDDLRGSFRRGRDLKDLSSSLPSSSFYSDTSSK